MVVKSSMEMGRQSVRESLFSSASSRRKEVHPPTKVAAISSTMDLRDSFEIGAARFRSTSNAPTRPGNQESFESS